MPALKIHTFITFKEIFPEENNTEQIARSSLKLFESLNLVEASCRLNYLLSESFLTHDTKEFDIARQLFREDKATLIIKELRDQRRLFTRQQILAVLREIFINLNPGNGGELVMNKQKEFGKILLRFNDFTEKDTLSMKANLTDVATNFARSIYFNAGEFSNMSYSLCRAWYIINTVIPEMGLSYLLEKFKTITNISPRDYLLYCFSIWAHFNIKDRIQLLNAKNEFALGKKYFSNLTENSKKDAYRVLDLLSNDFLGFKSGLQDDGRGFINEHFCFQSFWRKPFLKANDDFYLMLDNSYFKEKMDNGFLGTLHDECFSRMKSNDQESKKVALREMNTITSDWGKIVEEYAKSTIFGIVPKKNVFINSDAGGADLLIYDKKLNTLLVIEITKSSLTHECLISADKDRFRRELKRTFLGNDTNPKKIQQIHKTVEQIRSGKLKLPWRLNNPNIIPIILFDKAIPQHPILLQYYRELIKENNLLPDTLNSLQFLDLEGLELIAPFKKDFVKIFLDKHSNQDFRDFSMQVYVLHKLGRKDNYFMKKQLSQILDASYKMLFGKTQLQIILTGRKFYVSRFYSSLKRLRKKYL